MGNKVPDRAPYGSHLPSGIQYIANMAAAKKFHRTMSGDGAKAPVKNPKDPKDPNLNPAAMPFPRR